MTRKTSPLPDQSHSNNGHTSNGKSRIAVVESHTAARMGLTHFIQSDDRWEVAWACTSAEEAQDLALKTPPDALILSILLPGKDGLELIKYLLPLLPELKILVHSMHAEEFYAERCLRAGALGYLRKSDSLEMLKEAIERILHGDIFLSPRIARHTLQAIAQSNGHRHNDHHLHQLTDRELEIIILMAQGYSVHQTAEKLHISPRTAQVHRNNIRLKIGLESAAQLYAYAIRFYGEEREEGMAHEPQS